MARLGIKFPDTDSLPIEETQECARIADEAGFDSLWMSDYKSGDPFAVLSACAVATQRIRLGTGVVVVFNRAPTTLAMAAASLDTISKGRLILGIGQGHRSNRGEGERAGVQGRHAAHAGVHGDHPGTDPRWGSVLSRPHLLARLQALGQVLS